MFIGKLLSFLFTLCIHDHINVSPLLSKNKQLEKGKCAYPKVKREPVAAVHGLRATATSR